jgi:hypothetical protein
MTCFRLKNGDTLYSYCKKNKINYFAIYNRIEAGENLKDALRNYLNNKKKSISGRVKYFVGNKPLRKIINKKEYNRFSYYIHKKQTPDKALEKANIMGRNGIKIAALSAKMK